MNDEGLVLVFTPSLVATLLNRERAKGAPLTEEEVISIRDNARCMAVTVKMAMALDEKRGYDDIVPEDCWNEWQQARKNFDPEKPNKFQEDTDASTPDPRK